MPETTDPKEAMRDFAAELGDAIIKRLEIKDEAIVPQHSDSFNSWFDRRVNEKLRLWAFGIISIYLIPAIIIAFQLGGLSKEINDAMASQQTQNAQLASRQIWMREQEYFNREISRWAEEDPRRPFEPTRGITSGVIDGIAPDTPP